MYNPKISIIIPVYNGSNYLSEAIDSALAQTYDNVEIIVVNDGSNDNGETEKIALSYGDKIKYIKKENGGSSSALNTGIENMIGDYFSWLSHDDLYTPDHIEKMVAKINSKYENQVIISTGININVDGKTLPRTRKPLCGEMDNIKLFENLKNGRTINGCGIIIPKKVIDDVGFFDENFAYVNDIDYWYRLAIYGCCFTCITDELTKTRVHNGQVTFKRKNLYFKERGILANKIFDALFENVEKNIELIHIYMLRAVLDDNLKLVKEKIKLLKEKGKFKNIWYFEIYYNYFYGKMFEIARRIYGKIVYKR